MTELPSLERSLSFIATDPLGAVLLGNHNARNTAEIIWDSDPFGERKALERAAAIVSPQLDPLDWLEHRIWCAQRGGKMTGPPVLPLEVVGQNFVDETRGRPTLLLAPMTLCMADAISAIRQIFSDRPTVVFGEGVAVSDVENFDGKVAEGSNPKQAILSTLGSGGVYCTYIDFAYESRKTTPITIFGCPRTMSLGWLQLANRAGSMILPMVVYRTKENTIVAHCDEPVLVHAPGPMLHFTEFIEGLLEEVVRRAGTNWLLLPTLTFDSLKTLPER